MGVSELAAQFAVSKCPTVHSRARLGPSPQLSPKRLVGATFHTLSHPLSGLFPPPPQSRASSIRPREPLPAPQLNLEETHGEVGCSVPHLFVPLRETRSVL